MKKTQFTKSVVITVPIEDVKEVDRLKMLVEVINSDYAPSHDSQSKYNLRKEDCYIHAEIDRCTRCEKPISELEPFPKADYPQFVKFKGEHLAMVYRSIEPYDEEVAFEWNEACKSYKAGGFDNPIEWLINKYGQNKAEGIYFYNSNMNGIVRQWECRDCALLNDDEYFDC